MYEHWKRAVDASLDARTVHSVHAMLHRAFRDAVS
jgi:hypothetical protein